MIQEIMESMVVAQDVEREVRAWLAAELEEREGPVDLDIWILNAWNRSGLPQTLLPEVQGWALDELARANRHGYFGHRVSRLREGPAVALRGEHWD